mmetsp:Transcript_53553/g.93984  ORF Transcript_53553/g.93984 Transcript_53553/m.93984 type:complete len:83 (+) Transcript_53553:71-319(+)
MMDGAGSAQSVTRPDEHQAFLVCVPFPQGLLQALQAEFCQVQPVAAKQFSVLAGRFSEQSPSTPDLHATERSRSPSPHELLH